MKSRKSIDNENFVQPRPETSFNEQRPFTDEGSRQRMMKNLQKELESEGSGTPRRNIATANFSNNQGNFRVVPMPKPNPAALEKIGFATNEKNNNVHSYRPILFSSSLKRINNYMNPRSILRTQPKNIILDKERLYEENLNLKNFINEINKENTQLKTKLLNLDKENYKFEKIISDIDLINASKKVVVGNPSTTETTSMLNMKRKLKDLIAELQIKNQEIEKLKKKSKLTRINELESELKEFADETVRLRRMLDQSLRLFFGENKQNFVLEERMLLQASALTTLQKDYANVLVFAKKLEEDILKKNIKIQELDSQVALLKKDRKNNFQIKKISVVPENNFRRKRLNSINSPENDEAHLAEEKLKEQLKKDIESKTSEINVLNNKVHQKDKKILELEKKNKEISNDLTEKLDSESKEKTNLLLKLEKEKKENKLLNQKYQKALTEKGSKPEDDFSPTDIDKTEDQNQYKADSLIILKSVEKKKLSKVNFYDVEDISLAIKYNLILAEKNNDTIIELLFDESQINNGSVSILEIKESLSKQPFSIKEEDKRILLARYLIEDNTDEHVVYDPELTSSISIVRSVLNKVLGKIILPSLQEKNKMHHEITNQLSRYKNSLVDSLKSTSIKKGKGNKYTCKEDFLTCIKFCEINFKQKEYDYIFLKLYEITNNIDLFEIDSIYKIFDVSTLTKDLESEEEINDHDFSNKHSIIEEKHHSSEISKVKKSSIIQSDFEQNKNSFINEDSNQENQNHESKKMESFINDKKASLVLEAGSISRKGRNSENFEEKNMGSSKSKMRVSFPEDEFKKIDLSNFDKNDSSPSSKKKESSLSLKGSLKKVESKENTNNRSGEEKFMFIENNENMKQNKENENENNKNNDEEIYFKESIELEKSVKESVKSIRFDSKEEEDNKEKFKSFNANTDEDNYEKIIKTKESNKSIKLDTKEEVEEEDYEKEKIEPLGNHIFEENQRNSISSKNQPILEEDQRNSVSVKSLKQEINDNEEINEDNYNDDFDQRNEVLEGENPELNQNEAGNQIMNETKEEKSIYSQRKPEDEEIEKVYENSNNFNEEEINKEEEGEQINNKDQISKILEEDKNNVESLNMQEYEDLKFDNDFEDLKDGKEERGEKYRNEKFSNELDILDGENL